MTHEDYKKTEQEILEGCEKKLHDLRQKAVEEITTAIPGEFVKNVTGIIKIERIGYDMIGDNLYIVYWGYAYWWVRKGVLRRTKQKEMKGLRYKVEWMDMSQITVEN